MAQIDRRRSVRTQLPRLLLKFAITILVVMSIGSYYTFTQVRAKMRVMENNAIVALTDGTVAGLSDMIVLKDYSHLQETLRQSMVNDNIIATEVTDINGRVLAAMVRSGSSVDPVFPDNLDPAQVVPGKTGSITRHDNHVTVWQQIDNNYHIGWLKIELSTEQYDSVINSLIANLATTIAAMALGMGIIILIQFNAVYKEMNGYENQLLDAAHTDPLTKLANRLTLDQYVTESMKNSRLMNSSFALAFVDLDGFKDINDTLGHSVGDELLKQVATRFTRMLRSGDRVIRQGGDEFVIILNDIESKDVVPVLDKIRNRISDPYTINGSKINSISASIGVTEYPSNNTTPSKLIANADAAMYGAKSAGKNRIVHYKELASE